MADSSSNICLSAALQIAQESIAALLQWADSSTNSPDVSTSEDSTIVSAVERAKNILNFHPAPSQIGALRLLFDDVKLPNGKGKVGDHWCPMMAIADENPIIPYPLTKPPTNETDYKEEVSWAIAPIVENPQQWNNLSLLSLLLEKYGSCLSFGEENVALVDITRITGAVAAALAQNPNVENLSLIAGDLSGIQNFIYTISSDGALKSLRARSFYLELVTEEVVQQLLSTLELPRTSIIYAGGGNLYLLASDQGNGKALKTLQDRLNIWLRKSFQGKVFLALAHQQFKIDAVASEEFRNTWNEAIASVNQQKTAKFRSQIDSLLKPQPGYEPCRVCHRDDRDDLAPLNHHESDSPQACPICREMFELGGVLFDVNSMVRSHQSKIKDAAPAYILEFKVSDRPEDHVYYHLFAGRKPIIDQPEQVLLVNNWFVEDYAFSRFQGKVAPLLLGNYFREDLTSFQTAEEFAELSTGISRVGYLRMDVDKLGQIFANGLAETDNYSLPKVAGLSRQMSYFFKTYLNSLAAKRKENFLNHKNEFGFKVFPRTSTAMATKEEAKEQRQNLLFIYAGGDDLFVSGAWNEVVDFAFDVYQSFRAYTGCNPDITLSGGISLSVPKFPLYQAAKESGDAESKAKENGRDSLGMFGFAFKWQEWFGSDLEGQLTEQIIEAVENREEDYWEACGPDPNKHTLTLIGIMPFVTRILQQQLQINYSRSLVRNLLAAAQLQEQKIKELEDKQKLPEYKYQLQDFKYYLHLPQIAYTLARLPEKSFDDKDEKYRGFRKSLKSPYNAPYFRAIATWIELLTRNT